MMGLGCRFQPIANVAVRPIPDDQIVSEFSIKRTLRREGYDRGVQARIVPGCVGSR